MNTRTHDLDSLDASRSTATSQTELDHRNALLDSVYEQSKDPTLETLREELVYWITKGLSYAPENEYGIPTPKQRNEMAIAEMNIERIEKEIKTYAASPVFQAKLVKKMAKHSLIDAEVLLAKGSV